MTTRRYTLRRETVHDWPLLAKWRISTSVEVLSVEITRQAGEDVPTCIRLAAELLRDRALTKTDDSVVLAAARLFDPVNRLQEYLVNRDGLWGGLERDGVRLPAGTKRQERRVSHPGKSRFHIIGYIESYADQTVEIVDITRQENAVCLIGSSLKIEEKLGPVLSSSSPSGELSILKETLTVLTSDLMVARAYGAFDDREVGVDVFGYSRRLNVIQGLLDTD